MNIALRLALLGFALAVASTGIAVAQPFQDAPASSGSTATKPAHRAPDPQRQTARLSRELQLTPAQAAKIEPILQDRIQQMQQLRADTALGPSDRHAKIRAIMQDSNSKLEAVLTDSQKQQYHQMQMQAAQHRQEKQAPSTNDPDSE